MLINIKGIGFKRADEIAKALGIDPKSEFRINACINYTLREFCDNNGNSSIDKFHLINSLMRLYVLKMRRFYMKIQ